MREILFRAKGNKKYNNGGWYFGGGIGKDCDGDCYIQDNSFRWTVISDTVCQYTGLTDKNGTKIFEGDIIKTKFNRICLVNWLQSDCFCGWDFFPLEDKNKAPSSYDLFYRLNLEVIGNKFDNPELMRGVEK